MRDRDNRRPRLCVAMYGSLWVILTSFDMHGLLALPGHLPCEAIEILPGRLPGVGAFHSCGKNHHLGTYPGVGACPGDLRYVVCSNIGQVVLMERQRWSTTMALPRFIRYTQNSPYLHWVDLFVLLLCCSGIRSTQTGSKWVYLVLVYKHMWPSLINADWWCYWKGSFRERPTTMKYVLCHPYMTWLCVCVCVCLSVSAVLLFATGVWLCVWHRARWKWTKYEET